MADFKNKAKGFEKSIQLPKDNVQQDEWNRANKEWWEKNPMRYDFTEGIRQDEFTLDFFKEIDQRFFTNSMEYAPYKIKPFDTIIDFDFIKDKTVLEIGVGQGSHAQLIAQNCKNYIGIDLTDYATLSTVTRMKLLAINNAKILQMNAEKLQFDGNSFDYVWSWGVIHHSANTFQILKEIHRVLKPGGKCTVMVYHRSFWEKYVHAGLVHGIFKGYLFKEKKLDKVLQRSADGAIARFYRRYEWQKLCEEANLNVGKIFVMGQKTSLIILPPGKLKKFILKMIPSNLSRFFTNKLKWGSFLISDLHKV